MSRRVYDPRMLAITAVMAAAVFALTYIKLLSTPDGGYIHPGDAGIYLSAFAFGPWVAAIVGGLGTALADVAGGYPQWAPFSFLIHGAQGLVVGWMYRKWSTIWGMIAATVVGGVIVVVGYLPVGILLASPAQALASVPWNIIQVAIGGLISIPLFLLVRQAYPPINRLNRPS